MRESLRNQWSNLIRCLGPEPQKTRGLCQLCKIDASPGARAEG
jgi:hypothetical protein